MPGRETPKREFDFTFRHRHCVTFIWWLFFSRFVDILVVAVLLVARLLTFLAIIAQKLGRDFLNLHIGGSNQQKKLTHSIFFISYDFFELLLAVFSLTNFAVFLFQLCLHGVSIWPEA